MRRSSFLFRRTIRLGKTRTPFGENKYPAVFRFGTRSLSVFFGSAGKPETSEHNPIFANKTAGRRSSKPGLGLPISVFHRTSGSARRKYAANFGTIEHNGFPHKGIAGRSVSSFRCALYSGNFPHTSGLSTNLVGLFIDLGLRNLAYTLLFVFK